MPDLVLTEESEAAVAAELVGNEILHADGGPERPLQVQILRGPRWPVVTVSSRAPASGGLRNAEGRSESGRWELFLVDQIADRWGVECPTSDARVRFEIAYEEC